MPPGPVTRLRFLAKNPSCASPNLRRCLRPRSHRASLSGRAPRVMSGGNITEGWILIVAFPKRLASGYRSSGCADACPGPEYPQLLKLTNGFMTRATGLSQRSHLPTGRCGPAILARQTASFGQRNQPLWNPAKILLGVDLVPVALQFPPLFDCSDVTSCYCNIRSGWVPLSSQYKVNIRHKKRRTVFIASIEFSPVVPQQSPGPHA